MVLQVADRVGESTSNQPASAATAFNLGGAKTGFQTVSLGIGNGNSAIFVAQEVDGDGNPAGDWQTFVGTLTTGSPDTLSQDTILASSNAGSAVDWSSVGSSPDIYIVGDASTLQMGLFLDDQTLTTGNQTGAVGVLHHLTVSGMTADRDYVLPASANVGDRCGVMLATDAPSSTRYELQIKSDAAGDKINGVDFSSGKPWLVLFQLGETLIFRCVDAAGPHWIVESDGRIASSGKLNGSGATNPYTLTDVTWTFATDQLVTSEFDIGNIVDTTNGVLRLRRDGVYFGALANHLSTAITGNMRTSMSFETNDIAMVLSVKAVAGITSQFGAPVAGHFKHVEATNGDDLTIKHRVSNVAAADANMQGTNALWISVNEILQRLD